MSGMRGIVMSLVAALVAASAAAESDLVWLEKAELPLEGQAFPDAKPLYGRLSARHEGVVPEKVWRLSQSATGLLIRFETDARFFEVRWRVANEHPQDPLIPEAGLSGIDVYRLEGREGWKFQGNKRYWSNRYGAKRGDAPVPGEAHVDWRPGAAGLIYLPTRGTVLDFKVGVPKGCRFKAYAHEKGRLRPVVHYGTSIVHGGCASRPGLTFTAQVGRSLDIPYVNLGFSGAGQMETVMADVMAEVEASLYVVDCVWNMNPKLVEERTEAFLRRLKARRPETPILLAEGANSRESRLPTNDALYAVYAKLKNADPKMWAHLHYLAEEDILLRGDLEQTHDFCHPNDYGMMRMARSFEKAIGGILKLEPREWGVEEALRSHDMIRRAGGFRTVDELQAGLSDVRELYREFSCSNFVGPDTPPIRLYGSDLKSRDWIHHGLFAVNFKRVADAKGASNVELVMPNAPGRFRNDWAFIADLFGLML